MAAAVMVTAMDIEEEPGARARVRAHAKQHGGDGSKPRLQKKPCRVMVGGDSEVRIRVCCGDVDSQRGGQHDDHASGHELEKQHAHHQAAK